MQALKRTLSRSTHKVRRAIDSTRRHVDLDFEVLSRTLTREKISLENLSKHMKEMSTGIESQLKLMRSFAEDYKMLFSTGNDTYDARELEIHNQLDLIVDRIERDAVLPFLSKSTAMRTKLEEYLKEVDNMLENSLVKQRYSKLLDYEIFEKKYALLQTKGPASSSQMEKELSECAIAFENSKMAFENIDRQVKHEMRQVITKRYSVAHPIISEYMSTIISQYHERMGQIAEGMRMIRELTAPEPFYHEVPEYSGSRNNSPSNNLSNDSDTESDTGPNIVDEHILPVMTITPSETPEVFRTVDTSMNHNNTLRVLSPDITQNSRLDISTRLSADYMNAQHVPDDMENIPMPTPRQQQKRADTPIDFEYVSENK